MLVPVPPKSHSTMTPWDGTPGSDCSAEIAAAASDTNVIGCPHLDHSGTWVSAVRSASTAGLRQCAG